MIPVELGEASWTMKFAEHGNDNSLQVGLDLVQEVREEAQVQKEAAKLRTARHYNTRVQEWAFQKGDLVWRKVR